MMKKVYVKPDTQTMIIKTMGMIAASGTDIYNTEATDDALSRGGSFWDDEE